MGTTRRLPARLLAALLGVLAAVGGAGVAFAYWTSAGSGSANGASGSTAVLTVSSGTPTAALYPGTTSSVAAKLTNTGSADVRVSSLALATGEGTGGFDVDSGHSDCGLGSLGFTTASNGGNGWTVPANGSLSVTLTGALAMGTGADNECQGAIFTVHLKVAS